MNVQALVDFPHISVAMVILPLISALIGWLTNVIAIKLLFHPKRPLKLPGIHIQGIFPKRKDKIALSLSVFIADNLLSSENLAKQLAIPEKKQALNDFLVEHIADFISQSVPQEKNTLSSRIVNKILSNNRQKLAGSIAKRIPSLLHGIIHSEQLNAAIKETIYSKVSDYASDDLEHLLNQLVKKELKFVEVLGGVIGFVVGLAQLALLLLL